MNILKRNKMNIGVILITLIITATILYFNVYRFSGYKVSIGSSTITFVKSKKEFNKVYKELQNEIKSKYKKVVTKENFTLNKVEVDNVSMFISGDNLKKLMLKKFDIVVEVFLMKSDNTKLAYVRNENQGKEILNSLKAYYTKISKLSNITKTDIVNKIGYESVMVQTGKLYETREIVNELIKYNNKSKTQSITVKIVGNIIKKQIIYPKTIIKSSSKLASGVNQVQYEGIDGVKNVTTEITALNNNIFSEKFLKEEIIKPVQNKEVNVGNYKPIILQQSAYMNSPSRGSISSSFGMRWGKMHKGIDIAANLGTTINSVLDGTVSYAAWQEGYGNVIKINHGQGLETTYAHCSKIVVKKDEVVKLGEKIGEVGSTGNSTGPHLHFEVRENGEPKNPQKYIK